ncbi:MAG: carbonic anhydrase [Desulfosudaceae bacterium]
MNYGRFAAAINCMDGRIQLPVIKYLQENYGVKYVDIITEPGPIKYLEKETSDAVVETIKERLQISVEKHGSKIVAISGHHDCAGNPVDKEKQIKQIHGSVKTVESWGYNVKIIKLWINEKWEIEDLDS